MLKRASLTAGLVLVAGLAATTGQPAAAALYANGPIAEGAPQAVLQLADARSYHHCHNMPRRVRCHTKQRLPVNWPPNTNTPGTSSLRERHADTAGTCSSDHRGRRCQR